MNMVDRLMISRIVRIRRATVVVSKEICTVCTTFISKLPGKSDTHIAVAYIESTSTCIANTSIPTLDTDMYTGYSNDMIQSSWDTMQSIFQVVVLINRRSRLGLGIHSNTRLRIINIRMTALTIMTQRRNSYNLRTAVFSTLRSGNA